MRFPHGDAASLPLLTRGSRGSRLENPLGKEREQQATATKKRGTALPDRASPYVFPVLFPAETIFRQDQDGRI